MFFGAELPMSRIIGIVDTRTRSHKHYRNMYNVDNLGFRKLYWKLFSLLRKEMNSLRLRYWYSFYRKILLNV